jgi:hypothetical protein
MPPRREGLRHLRAAPCVDLAACGERGAHLRFACGESPRRATCDLCKAAREVTIAKRNARRSRESAR